MDSQQNDISAEIVIRDKVAAEAGLTLNWNGINNMIMRSHRIKDICNKDLTSKFAPCEGVMYEHEPQSMLYEPQIRKLVNESSGTFIASRSVPLIADVNSCVLHFSREHRSSLRQCIENLQAKAVKEENEKYSEWADMFQDIEILWHLCELLHLDVVPGDVVLPRLLEWIQFQSSECETKASVILTYVHTKGAEQRHPEYWEIVIKLLLQGRFEAARALLRLHSDADTKPFLEADYLLRIIPVYSVYCGLSASEFNGRWKSWKSTVRTKIKTAMFESRNSAELLTIMNILGGEEVPIDEIKPYCENWYHLMIAMLLFMDPTVKMNELYYHSKQCINHYGGPSSLKRFDHTLLAIFDSDVNNVIKKLLLGSDGGWSAVHLANLLDLSGYFKKADYQSDREKLDVEPLIVDYSELLIAHESLWQVGVCYIEQCPVLGKFVMEELLARVPIVTEKKALKVLSTAKRLGLKSLATSVCKVMGTKYLNSKHIGNALTWALMSEDNDFSSMIADHYLRRYTIDGELECSDTLLHLGQSVFVSGRLTFLAKYCQFHELYQEGEIKEAAALLIRLLDSKVSPKYFWLTLLCDALPLLESSGTPVFSHDDTTILLGCLEELSTDLADDPVAQKPAFNKKTQMIRRAIAKNLATTQVLESCPLPTNKIIKCYI